MIVINFAHPLTEEQRAQLEVLTGQTITAVYDVACHFDNDARFAAQAAACVDGVGISAADWQGNRLLVNPPGYAPAASTILAELHGRMGHFPTIIRIRPVADSTPTRYEVAEVINLQEIRTDARNLRRGLPDSRKEIF